MSIRSSGKPSHDVTSEMGIAIYSSVYVIWSFFYFEPC